MQGVETRLAACLLLVLAVSGCGWWQENEEQAFEDDLPALDLAVTSDVSQTPKPKDTKRRDKDDDKAETDLSPGTRIPLRRRVVQTLTQGDVVHRTTLDLEFTISIDEIVDEGARRFGIHYERVRYRGDVGGTKFEYDSKDSGAIAPYQALPFHGLVDNSFYFWIDNAGQMKLVGFDRFLRRCVERLPLAEREAVLARLSGISDAQGVSLFVDETIGLLAGGTLPSQKPDALKEGTRWTDRRKLGGEVPMQIVNDYTVKSLTKTDVEIEIRGIVGPSPQSILPVSQRTDPLVTVRGGKIIGICRLDRRTGLTRSSQIEQSIDMAVELADGTRFEQRKRIVSTTSSPGDDEAD